MLAITLSLFGNVFSMFLELDSSPSANTDLLAAVSWLVPTHFELEHHLSTDNNATELLTELSSLVVSHLLFMFP